MALIIIFENSSNLAGIYGIAITGMMTIDTILLFFVLWKAENEVNFFSFYIYNFSYLKNIFLKDK